MKYISDKRDGNKWWCTYPCLNGDLISMSYLDAVSRFNPPKPNPAFKHPAYSGTKYTDLYLDGDSYTWALKDSDFAGLSSLHYFQRVHGYKYHLDTTKRNILLIEISERYLQSYFSGLHMFNEVFDTARPDKISKLTQEVIGSHYASVLPSFDVSTFFNKNINQNLQCNLFNYNIIIPMFEYKAALNYYVFNRASGDVVISNDRKFLFYKETVSKTDVGSSYFPVTAGDAANIVDVMNNIYEHYRAGGFAEVYVSIIPNSPTIMQPEGYNNLIPMVQNDPRLKMKVIDIYTVFKNSKDVYYLPGDTHWNHNGKQRWLDLVNEQVLKQ